MDSLLDLAGARPAPHRLSADQYYAMSETGILREHDRIELIEGEIVEMAPVGQGHESAVLALTQGLVLACVGRGIVSVQNSIRIDHWNVPEPDFAVFRSREDFYRTGARPTPTDTLLVVEVAESSLNYDQTVKLPLYARAGIPEYWIVNLRTNVIDVYRRPDGGNDADRAEFRAGQTIALLADPEIRVKLDTVFG